MLPQTTGVDAVITFVEPFLVLLKKNFSIVFVSVLFLICPPGVSAVYNGIFFLILNEMYIGPLPHHIPSQGSRSIKGPSHIHTLTLLLGLGRTGWCFFIPIFHEDLHVIIGRGVDQQATCLGSA